MNKLVLFAFLGMLAACTNPPDQEKDVAEAAVISPTVEDEGNEIPAKKAILSCLQNLDNGNFQSCAKHFVSYDELEIILNEPQYVMYSGERKYLHSLEKNSLRDLYIQDFNRLSNFTKQNSLIWDTSNLEIVHYKKSNFLAKTMHEGEIKLLLGRQVIKLMYRTLSTESGEKLLSFEHISV